MKLLHLLVDTLFFWNRNDNGRSVQYGGRVTSLRLVHAPSGLAIANLVNGTTIYLHGTAPPLTVVAVTSASIIPLLQGVQFNLDNAVAVAARIDRVAPYTLCGARGDNYKVCPLLGAGTHTVTAMALDNKVPYTVTFTLVAGTPVPATLAPTIIRRRFATLAPTAVPTSPVPTLDVSAIPTTKATPTATANPTVAPMESITANPTVLGTNGPTTAYTTASPTESSPTRTPTTSPSAPSPNDSFTASPMTTATVATPFESTANPTTALVGTNGPTTVGTNRPTTTTASPTVH
jgi:hypothetical protein